MSNDVSFANEAIWDKNRAAVILTAEQAESTDTLSYII